MTWALSTFILFLFAQIYSEIIPFVSRDETGDQRYKNYLKNL